MASVSAKFLLVTVLVHLGLVILAVHAEEEEETELANRGFKKFMKKIKCKMGFCKDKNPKGEAAAPPPAEAAPPADAAPPAEGAAA
ncbi:hypothetical protein MHYP_G00276820 [Metynnis hypsauchen]